MSIHTLTSKIKPAWEIFTGVKGCQLAPVSTTTCRLLLLQCSPHRSLINSQNACKVMHLHVCMPIPAGLEQKVDGVRGLRGFAGLHDTVLMRWDARLVVVCVNYVHVFVYQFKSSLFVFCNLPFVLVCDGCFLAPGFHY